MKKSFLFLLFFSLLSLSTWAQYRIPDPDEDPGNPCYAPSVRRDTFLTCQNELPDTFHIRYGTNNEYLLRIVEVNGDTTFADTIKHANVDCDSLVIQTVVTVNPSYYIIIPDTFVIPVGQPSVQVHGRLECYEEGWYRDTMATINGCDSIEEFYVTREIASGYCGGEVDGTNLQWSLTTDTILTISGYGIMADYEATTLPWEEYNHLINEVRFEGEITSIGKSAFFGCYNLRAIEIPSSVTSIGQNAFSGCESLTTVYIPANVTQITHPLFAQCTSLTSVNVAESNPNYSSLDGVFFDKNQSQLFCYPADRNGAYTIPMTVTDIAMDAFYRTGLRYVYLPKGLTHISPNAFFSNASLESIVCPATTPPYSDGSPFYELPEKACLYVPSAAIETYAANSNYSSAFSYIKGFSDTQEIKTTSATISWFPDYDISAYTLSIYKGETLIREYDFDSLGVLTDTRAFAPGIMRMRKDTTVSTRERYVATVDDLDPGVSYSYSVTGSGPNHSSGTTSYHEEGTFRTANYEEGLIDEFAPDQRTRKILVNGHVYIMQGEQLYDITGQHHTSRAE